jgi:hypothetical protein
VYIIITSNTVHVSEKYITHQMVRASADLIAFGIGQRYIDEPFQTQEWNRIGEPIVDDPNKPFE